MHHLKLLFSIVLLSCFGVSSAQNYTLKGQVTDSRSGEEIIGANVIISGTSQGAATDVFGNFTISGVPKGEYTLIVSYVTYITKEVNVKLDGAARELVLNIKLDEDVSELSSVTVVGEKKRDTDIALMSTMKASMQVVSGVSSEQISKTQDRDAAAVVRRVPGVTLQGNRFVVIRGLADRYNNVMLHNAFTPSMEADVKSFSFDVIPASQIEQILIYKSPSADLPGEFAGGLVKIFTKSIPDQNSMRISYGTQFRQGTTFGAFLGNEGNISDFFGFNNRRFDLPDFFPHRLQGFSADNPELIAAGRSLENNWIPDQRLAIPDQRFSLELSFREDIGSAEIGNISAVTFSNAYSIFDVTRQDFNAYNFDLEQQSPLYNFNDQQFNNNTRLGLMHNWAVRFGNGHTIEFKNLFNQMSNHQYIHRTGRDFDFSYNPDNHSFMQVYRGIYTGQLVGKHQFNDFKTKLDWVVGYNASYRDQPDYRRYRSDRDEDTNEKTLYVPFGAAQAFFLGRFYSEMKERAATASLNISHKFGENKWGYFTPTLSAGAFFEDKNRSFDARNIGYVRNSINNFDQSLLDMPIDFLFQQENINNTTGIRIDEQTNPSDSYTATNRNMAAYVMGNLPITRKLKLTSGLRLEDNNQTMNSFTLTNQPINEIKPVTRLLPSANLTYDFSDKTLARTAYGQTLNRPEFREIAPFGFYDFDFNLVKVGNPNLETPVIHNLDLRVEHYPTPLETVSFGLFYKKFINPIETLFVPGGGSGGIKTFTYGNAEESTSYGIEVELRKSLAKTYIPIIEDIDIMINGSLIQSEVILGGQQGLGQSNQRPLQGQSPYIFNSGLFYNNYELGLQVNLLYNVIGRRIFIIGFDDYPDIYEMPRNLLDFNISKTIGQHWQLTLSIKDIINQPMLLLQDANNDGKFDRINDQRIQNFRPGSTFSLTASYMINKIRSKEVEL